MKKYVIIVAGGSGTRMNSPVSKQFLELNGQPILMHTVNRFVQTDQHIAVILVLPANEISHWEELCRKYDFKIPHLIAHGGETRFHSVKNGLEKVQGDAIVAVHDAVRPLVSLSTIKNAFAAAEKQGNAIPVVPLKESLREVNDGNNSAVDRSKFFIVQTPQCFHSSILFNAYMQNYTAKFTDDASVVEAMGEKINMIAGNDENIKITNPGDLLFASVLMKNNI